MIKVSANEACSDRVKSDILFVIIRTWDVVHLFISFRIARGSVAFSRLT